MATADEVIALARTLAPADRDRVLRELGSGSRGVLPQVTGAAPRLPAPQSVAWLKAERGHAVLATDTGPQEADIPAGADAIAGMWSDTAGGAA